jgi:selenocysteine-specific elongation factor
VEQFIQKADQSGFSPPSVKECRAELGEDVFQYLLDSERILRVSDDVLFTHGQYDRAVDWVVSELKARNTLSVADVRNGLGTTRKYALALMEYLDQIGITVRDGDVRRLV